MKTYPLEIETRLELGYSTPVYRWECPLCVDHVVEEDMDLQWVQDVAVRHMLSSHNATAKAEFIYKPKLYKSNLNKQPAGYQVVVLDLDVASETLGEKEYVFTECREAFAAEEAGATWLKKFPDDIVMIVEVYDK